MQGERLAGSTVAARGLTGDRAYAVFDHETGFIASAKHPRKWARLFACAARFEKEPLPGAPVPPVLVTLPDGTTVSSVAPEADDLLSRALGRRVSLVSRPPRGAVREADRTPPGVLDGVSPVIRQEAMARAAPGTFFDYAPVHILSTATLAAMRAAYPGGTHDVRRFRPNVLVESSGAEPLENRWLGRCLRAGANVRLDVIDPTPRCVVITLAQDGLPGDPEILRALAAHAAAPSVTLAPGTLLRGTAGVYAAVLEPGTLRPGDTVELEQEHVG